MPAQWTGEIVGKMHMARITQTTLAAHLGVTREYVTNILNGHRNSKDAEARFRAAVVLLSAVFGEYWYLFAAFLLFNVVDFFTGWYKAHKLGKESSSVGWHGAAKKVGYWCIIAVAFVIASAFVHLGKDLLGVGLSFLTLLGWFTLASLMVNEARSICENLVEVGVEVTEIITKGLKITQEMIDKSSSKP